MLVIKNGKIHGSAEKGARDILIGGGKILAMAENLHASGLPGAVDVLDAAGAPVCPGFIDGHQHFTGGGGEGGFRTRAPEMQLTMNTLCGVTTAVGLLGTDALTRTVKNLYAKASAFDEEGITAFMLTGSYWMPSPTITGRVADDLVYLDKCIGVKLALSDVRGPVIDSKDLAQLAAEIRVAALVSGKPGFITVHMGIKPERLELVREVVEAYGIRADMFVLTHVNRSDEKLQEQAFELAKKGAFLDATGMVAENRPGSLAVPAAEFAVLADGLGLWDQVAFSSDAGGSMPHWDKDHKNIVGMSVASPDSLGIELGRLVGAKGVPLEKALRPFTATPARIYGLSARKGGLFEGADADVLVLDEKSLRPRHVVAKGVVMVRDFTPVKKGYFEDGLREEA